jgi:hypothetical protein
MPSALPHMFPGQNPDSLVVRDGVEPPTFRFSGWPQSGPASVPPPRQNAPDRGGKVAHPGERKPGIYLCSVRRVGA